MSYPTVPSTSAPSSAITAPRANTTAIKAIAVADRSDGMAVIDASTQNQWIFSAGSSAGASSSVLVPDVGTGRWLLDPSTMGVSAAASAEALAIAAQADATQALADAAAAAAKVPKVVSTTITHADLTAVSTTQTLTVGAVPAGARYMCLTYVISPLFSGGGVATLDMDLGWSGADNAILDGSGVGLDLIAGTPAAALNVYNTQSGTVGDPRTIASKTVTATFTCDGGHTLDQLTAGSVFIEITYFVPA